MFILFGLAILLARRLSGAPTLGVADSAAMVAALEEVGIPGEGGDTGTAADRAADAAAAVSGTDGAERELDEGPEGEADQPIGAEDDLTSLLAPKGDLPAGAPPGLPTEVPPAATTEAPPAPPAAAPPAPPGPSTPDPTAPDA